LRERNSAQRGQHDGENEVLHGTAFPEKWLTHKAWRMIPTLSSGF
jgi:hypothetical protein